MAVEYDEIPVKSFDDWYVGREENDRTGCLESRSISSQGSALLKKYQHFKREMDARCANFDKLEKQADGEVISKKPDLPNISSGETAGIVRRIARNLVQNTPNVEILNEFDDDSALGVFALHMLRSKIIMSDTYSNDMQQNLFASVKTGLTTGFACVIPCLLQDAAGSWYIKYDPIHYRDVFPEPGAKDIRDTPEVFVRRYLSKGEILALIRSQPDGWDIAALKELLRRSPNAPSRESQSTSHQDSKRRVIAEGYEIVTWYNSGGAPFLTFSPTHQMLFRIEKNLHPLKEHPVFFLILEKDDQQPLGKSQVELLLGRQEFQDLMLNGAMKLWYRNINPSIIGYGTVGSIPNLSPGKYTQISNPNAKVEPFEVNTQTLMQYNAISQANLGSMVNMVGSADQQMATQAGNGMSATPQGVEAQQAMVDITTNNYQKSIESFFSHYCSYALTMYFQELKSTKGVIPSADARHKLINAGISLDAFNENGELSIDFANLAVQYYVRCVPGSLVEMEDEKQLRLLNQLFVPLSQAMPALAATQDQKLLQNAAFTMQYIMEKQIELSGSSSSNDIKSVFQTGRTQQFNEYEARADSFEKSLGGVTSDVIAGVESSAAVIGQLQKQISMLSQTQQIILQKLGVPMGQSTAISNNSVNTTGQESEQPANISMARA